MNKKQLIFSNAIFISLMIFSSMTVYQYMTGNKPLQALKSFINPPKHIVVKTDRCSDKSPNTGLQAKQSSAMAALAVYQQVCHSQVTDTMMIFTSMPNDIATAVEYANKDAKTLLTFSKSGVRPLVIAEPTNTEGKQLDFAKLADGSYNSLTSAYFAQLKAKGLTDAQLGIWNPLPEANLPYWSNNAPEYFAPAINNYLTIARQYFPSLQTSIMLNSATYSTTDFNWESGEYSSLLQYVKGIKPGLIDYAGMQGFPWLAESGGSGAILNGAEFLNPSLISEVADSLKIKKIWLNTGTFGSKYALDPNRRVSLSPEKRSAIFATVITQAVLLQQHGYTVSINVFAKDKSKEPEETDWSYWTKNKPFESNATPVITNFIGQLNRQKINFWLFAQ